MSGNSEPLSLSESVARFIPFGSRIRADGSVKPEAFMPPPSLELSVTRVVERDELDFGCVGSESWRLQPEAWWVAPILQLPP